MSRQRIFDLPNLSQELMGYLIPVDRPDLCSTEKVSTTELAQEILARIVREQASGLTGTWTLLNEPATLLSVTRGGLTQREGSVTAPEDFRLEADTLIFESPLKPTETLTAIYIA